MGRPVRITARLSFEASLSRWSARVHVCRRVTEHDGIFLITNLTYTCRSDSRGRAYFMKTLVVLEPAF